jgi:hypothetical protein
MTTYAPNPVVTFAGGNVYSDNTIADISINIGRKDVIEPVAASYARIVLWTQADTPLNVNLSDSVTIEIDKGTTGTSTIYTGIISDIDITLPQYGDAGSIAEYTLTAVGPLANLNKRVSGASGFPKQFDGDRMFAILSEAFLTSWDDLSPSLIWSSVSNIATWDSFDGVNIATVDGLMTTIDQPGVYELHAYSDGVTNALSLAQDTAQSGRGVLYESGDGHLHYGDYTSRISSPSLNLTTDDLLIDGLRTAAQWSEIVNDVTITYKNDQQKYARDEVSVESYGELSGSRDTTLEKGSDAQSQADDFLASRAYPRVYPESLTVALHNPNVSDATRDALIAAENGTAITTSDLPAVFGTIFAGYLEGYSWRLTRYEAYLDLICSSQLETYPHQLWLQVPPLVTWASYTPNTTEWMDL